MQGMKVSLKRNKDLCYHKAYHFPLHLNWVHCSFSFAKITQNVITSTLFTWEPKKWLLMQEHWGREASWMVETFFFPESSILPGFLNCHQPGNTGSGVPFCTVPEFHSHSIHMEAHVRLFCSVGVHGLAVPLSPFFLVCLLVLWIPM